MKTPLVITANEWREIMELPQVIEAWGLTLEDYQANVLGVKFNFTKKLPNSPGDLYILSDGEPYGTNMMIRRIDNQLFVDA